ncbi:MAG: hypothetical protein ACFFDW_05860 [Candidatus Thorarchaeota archaeon]
MPICEKCNSFIDENINVCPFCGHKIHFSQLPTNQPSDTIIQSINETNIEGQISPSRKRTTLDTEDEDKLVVFSPNIDEIELEEFYEKDKPLALEKLPQRNYLVWFALGIISFGIMFIVYLYLNLEDLEKHSMYPNEYKARPIEISASSILILFIVSVCFLFIPILWYIYYKKYATLYYHLKDQSRETAPNKIIHPAYYLTPLILSNVLALVHPIVYTITTIDIRTTFPILFWILVGFIIALSIIVFILDYFWQKAYNTHSLKAMINIGIDLEIKNDS